MRASMEARERARGDGAPGGRAALERLRGTWAALRLWVAADWRGRLFLPFGVALVLVTALAAVLYSQNMPAVVRDPDTPAYLAVAQRYLGGAFVVDSARLPGYPLLIAAVLAVAGHGNLAAVSDAQAALFVLAVAELYLLLCLLLRRALPAFLAALLAGLNVQLLSYVKPILSEALALLLVTSVALAVALFIRVPRARRLWAVALCLLALLMTRPEWLFIPAPLFAYLLFVAWRRRTVIGRRLLPHALAALALLYGVIALYVHANAVQNGCATVTNVPSFNLLGKVMQYGMQDEAPARYAALTLDLDAYLAAGGTSPWQFVGQTSALPLGTDCLALVHDYSVSILVRHPVEYAAKALPIAAQTLTETTLFRPIQPGGPHAPLLAALNQFAAVVTLGLALFPPLALAYWAALALRRGRAGVFVEMMGALALLAFYGVALSALGSYAYYPRLRTPYAPLLIAVVYGSAAALLARMLPEKGQDAPTGREPAREHPEEP